ncbi:hypothetical protein K458DRAFT_488960 [Lentithecium fluviatile CBS 122367]|uniref:Uncharacterized protein n=1 Tax=Lentithecium fluviatile CBS 122367 TaxID=1168545 RepID=A0A6G1IUB5_9PLEO|nr:hypothetical protein K458DRAFT_488960 [Lentithecium fluviatile CBS 122367]
MQNNDLLTSWTSASAHHKDTHHISFSTGFDTIFVRQPLEAPLSIPNTPHHHNILHIPLAYPSTFIWHLHSNMCLCRLYIFLGCGHSTFSCDLIGPCAGVRAGMAAATTAGDESESEILGLGLEVKERDRGRGGCRGRPGPGGNGGRARGRRRNGCGGGYGSAYHTSSPSAGMLRRSDDLIVCGVPRPARRS